LPRLVFTNPFPDFTAILHTSRKPIFYHSCSAELNNIRNLFTLYKMPGFRSLFGSPFGPCRSKSHQLCTKIYSLVCEIGSRIYLEYPLRRYDILNAARSRLMLISWLAQSIHRDMISKKRRFAVLLRIAILERL
jgi:hypothetical protein